MTTSTSEETTTRYQVNKAGEIVCGPSEHDYYVSNPIMDDAGKRWYDLICPRCGDARSVTPSSG